MAQLRIALIGMAALVALFTLTAVQQDGFDLVTPFFTPILAMTWPGQFHIDFVCYLVLSGMWMAWRSGFSGGGIALGILAPPLGILFFAPYLLYLLSKSDGNVRSVILGVHAEG